MGFTDLTTTEILVPLLADIGLLVVLLVVMTVDIFTKAEDSRKVGIIAAVGILLVMGLDLIVGLSEMSNPAFSGVVLGGMLRYDMLALIFRVMIMLAAALTCLISLDVPKIGRQGEFYAVLIVATMGMALMATSADLIMVFLSLETTSISLYVLAGFLREDKQSTEAGIKYYLFGSFIAGLFLYGLSLLYGFTGTTNIYLLADALRPMLNSAEGTFSIIIAMLLLFAGFGFKITAVPFHFWAPDVYEGSPTPVTAFISTASKAASFALLMRVFDAAWPGEMTLVWTSLLAAIAAITMTVGNLLALVQTNIKRLLAYSSIAQAGYALIGVVALSELGVASVTYYMFMYVLTNIAAFTVIIIVSGSIGSDEIKDYASLAKRSPYLALVLVLAFLSLSGVPPLAGFIGKFFIFAAAVESGYVWLAIVGVLNSILALYYYLTVIKVMYVDPTEDTSPIIFSQAYTVVLFITGGGILIMGIIVSPWYSWMLEAAASFVANIP